MALDRLAMLRHLLQTLAFCLTVSTLLYSLQSQVPYEVPLVYSLCIGVSTWALIDFGRHLFASSAQSGWPQGAAALALPLGAIVGGYLLGTVLADHWFGWSSWGAHWRDQGMASVLVTACAGGSACYYFYSRAQKGYLEQRLQQADHQALQARLKLLEAQLEPHMLFNTLANLHALIATDPARAQSLLDHLGAYLRATLQASRASTHSLESEFARLRDYLELMAVRMGARLQYTLDLPSELRQQSVPTLLLQTLVENAIRHGLEPLPQGGQVRVSASRCSATVELHVQDSGVGFDGQLAPEHAGQPFGLQQVRERLHSTFGAAAALEFVRAEAGGTCARIHYPCDP